MNGITGTFGLALAVFGALVASRPLAAQPIPLGAEQPVNEETASTDFDPAIGVSAAGDFVVVWSRVDGDGSGDGLFGRSSPAAGPLGSEFAVNTFTTGFQSRADVDMNSSRDFTVAWDSLNQASGTSGFDLVARQSSDDGTVLSNEFFADEAAADQSLEPAVASDDADGFVVAWHGGTDTLFARQFDDAGAPGTLLTVAVGTINIRPPELGVDAQRGFVVVWEDADSSGSGIWGRIYDELGANPSAIFPVNSDETGGQSGPSVAVAAIGEFVVAWTDFSSTLGKVEGRRFKADGTPIGAEFPISPEDGNHHLAVAVDGDLDGSFVAVWTRQLPGGDGPDRDRRGAIQPTRIVAREYQRTASPVDEAFEETAQPAVDAQKEPAVGVGGKLWIVVWVAPDADSNGIYARSYVRRAIFADDFEGEGLELVWSSLAD